MIKLKKKEKVLLRKFLKRLDIKFYDLTDKEQLQWYKSVGFQSLLIAYKSAQATIKIKQAYRKPTFKQKFFKILFALIILSIIVGIIYSFILI